MYVLRYTGGPYVKRDDSVGPMATGGYPYPVTELADATRFATIDDAAHYANIFRWEGLERAVFELNITLATRHEAPANWEECDRHCIRTPQSTSIDACHFLDCDLMQDLLRQRRVFRG